jgi:transcription antitermination factor NusG
VLPEKEERKKNKEKKKSKKKKNIITKYIVVRSKYNKQDVPENG